jgi:3-hydroxyisobutyrate dehydrogenase-like beta-hydroxyacid dehydrogenase
VTSEGIAPALKNAVASQEPDMTKPVVGFIGLGLMGAGFTRRLVETGHRVVGYDIVAEKRQAAKAWGVEEATSPGEVAAKADIVEACVMTKADLTAVIEGPGGIIAGGGARAKIFVDHSTSEIETTKRLAAELKSKAGCDYIDAPISGGPDKAREGTLALMAGGEQHALARARPVLECLGRVTHMGPVGAGQATKLVNQVLVLNGYCVIAEALRLAESYGVDGNKINAALETGFAGSNLLPHMLARMVPRDWTPKGYAFQCLKDMEMLNEAAKARHLAMPMSAQALTLFRMLVARGMGEMDGAAVLEMLPPGDPA